MIASSLQGNSITPTVIAASLIVGCSSIASMARICFRVGQRHFICRSRSFSITAPSVVACQSNYRARHFLSFRFALHINLLPTISRNIHLPGILYNDRRSVSPQVAHLAYRCQVSTMARREA